MEITTVHNETVLVMPGRTAVEERNGFTNAVRIFPTTALRDAYLATKRREAMQFLSTSLVYRAY